MKKSKVPVKKVAKKVAKKVVQKAVKEVPSSDCEPCNGRGLLDRHTICPACKGHGKTS